jgi:O-acetyl-ADP-ribose deacetylase (regulator of RNase III)
MKILLTDLNVELVSEWVKLAPDYVECHCRDIFAQRGDAIVSPANSFGFMDGGIDMAYTRRFGWHVQGRVQHMIVGEYGGELLVGQALTVPTDDEDFPFVIAAPTMRVPIVIGDVNAVRISTRAAIREAMRIGAETLIMPGMGTLTGQVHPEVAAKLMMAGIDDAKNPKPFPTTLHEAWIDHHTAMA